MTAAMVGGFKRGDRVRVARFDTVRPDVRAAILGKVGTVQSVSPTLGMVDVTPDDGTALGNGHGTWWHCDPAELEHLPAADGPRPGWTVDRFDRWAVSEWRKVAETVGPMVCEVRTFTAYRSALLGGSYVVATFGADGRVIAASAHQAPPLGEIHGPWLSLDVLTRRARPDELAAGAAVFHPSADRLAAGAPADAGRIGREALDGYRVTFEGWENETGGAWRYREPGNVVVWIVDRHPSGPLAHLPRVPW